MLKLHGYYGNGAILQRGRPVTVSGFSEGETLCTLSGGRLKRQVRTRAENGTFRVVFPEITDTVNEFTLSVQDEHDRLEYKIRFGDVYIAAGQSNMSYVLSAAEDYENWLKRAEKLPAGVLNLEEAPFSDLSEITRPPYPLTDFCREYAWKYGRELKGVSALSVMTAALLSEKSGVPVGVVHTAMGGLSAETYMSRATCEMDAELVEFLKKTGRYTPLEQFNAIGTRNYTQLGGVYNEKIAPLEGFSFSGIIWYLGESSAWDYEVGQGFGRIMRYVIKDFAALFGVLPFVAVMIAPEYYAYGDGYGYLYVNEEIADLEDIPFVSAVPIYDIEPRWLKPDGDFYFHPIHTVNKAPVAERIAKALSGDRTKYPRIVKVERAGGKAVCTVAEGKLETGAEYCGFTVAGENGKYYPARARAVSENKIEVYGEEAENPVYVTYAFMQYQDFCNAKDITGAPLLPYRSVKEPVGEGYCFPPAFTVRGAEKVYENCFGWNVGSCRKVPVWGKGVIYDASDVNITVNDEGVTAESLPSAEKYSLFGVSPAICLSGHKNHIADYDYWNITLSGEAEKGEVSFEGIVVRAANGDVFRPLICCGGKNPLSVPLKKEPAAIAVCWKKGYREDLAELEFDKKMRKSFVQAEFLFRAVSRARINIKDVSLSDTDRSEEYSPRKENAEGSRSDAVLPENS